MNCIQARMDELEFMRINLMYSTRGKNKGKLSSRKYKSNHELVDKIYRQLERLEIAQYYVEHPSEYKKGLKVLPPVLALLWVD